jgi:hypothetical protein
MFKNRSLFLVRALSHRLIRGTAPLRPIQLYLRKSDAAKLKM